MAVYYNENNPHAAEWLKNLIGARHIAPGEVDCRSIVDVRPSDLAGFTQCHFFAGIGGWSRALRLAGWSDERPVWTGSCPCQTLSSAARGRNVAEDMWPAWRTLLAAMRPREFFGEQVAQKVDWLDRLCDEMEPLGYQIGAAVLPSISVGKDHSRPRLYFVGYADGNSKPGGRFDAEVARVPRDRGNTGGMVPTDGISDRVALFSAFGNAIDPDLAAEFIGGAMNAMEAL